MPASRFRHAPLVLAIVLLIGPAIALAGASATAPRQQPSPKWGPAPAVFPKGAEMAVMSGDPSKRELFTVRLRFPNGYRIAPHTHPTDEHVTVIEGSFKVGMGSTFDESKMMTLPVGGFVTAPAEHAHFAKAVGATVVQVHAIGPFALTYVNPSDAPKAGGR